MEAPEPMDRLICGDVGYGKTEIAMRAAFKAVDEGEAGGVPGAHDDPRRAALRDIHGAVRRFPVKIAMLSRFVAEEGARKTAAKRSKEGKVDIAIGTHRLIQKDVEFKNLGLLVVDEEQRFGVKHKERLKQIKASVDCLTLTATPIPRTLHMSPA